MILTPMSVLEKYPIRKTKKQKSAFRADVKDYLESLEYPVTIEKDSFGCHNVVIGNPENAKYVITAHYDTPAGLPFPNLITPCNLFTFLLWQIATLIFLLILPTLAYWAGNCISNSSLGTILSDIVLVIEFALMMIGPANRSNANDNTSGVVTVLNIAANLPTDLRDKVCFVLFDFEEAGLLGSSAYAKKYSKAIKNQIVLNLDCVGDGDNIVLFPTSKLLKNKIGIKWLSQLDGATEGCKKISVRTKGFSFYPSDQANFPLGVGIAALKNKCGILYCDKIHTKSDTMLDRNNIDFLSKNLTRILQHADDLSELSNYNRKSLPKGFTTFLFFIGCIILGLCGGAIMGMFGF